MFIRAAKVIVHGLNDTVREFENAEIETDGNFMAIRCGVKPGLKTTILSSATVGVVTIEGEARETDE